MDKEKKSIAVIMTVHNRKDTTLKCLSNLYNCIEPANVTIIVYLMDDGSTDGTCQAVQERYNDVKVLKGNGYLFWNRGMRECWLRALKDKHDFYLWLNDDTILYENALQELIEVYNQVNPKSIIAGQLSSSDRKKTTYGGKAKGKVIPPTGQIELCEMACGNVLLIPQSVVDKIGILSNFYTHKWGDFDYTIRAVKKGICLYTTRCYVGSCDKDNVRREKWCDPSFSLKERIKFFKAPTGPTPIEYVYYCFRTRNIFKALMSSIYGNVTQFKRCLFPK